MSEPGERLHDNRNELITAVTRAAVAPPRIHPEALAIAAGRGRGPLPGTGGIALGVHTGDSVSAWEADHLMVGASIEDAESSPAQPGATHLLACVGNRVRDASGSPIGVVAGKRGGLAPGFFPPNLVSIEAPDERLAGLVPGMALFVRTRGRGLALLEFPEVTLLNLSPEALDALPVRPAGDRLRVDVRAIVPPTWAGPGLGQDPWVGDLEIAEPDWEQSLGLDLRFADLVAFDQIDGAHGRFFRPGYVSVGLVAHGPSPQPAHGPGVTLLLSAPSALLSAVTVKEASLAGFLRAAGGAP